jgi:DNA invertase Pin-like site-specific DNA recombinase
MKIGYARVSARHQNLDRQLTALQEAGCDKIFSEHASAKTVRKRPQLARALAALRPGDVFVVAEWDRAVRSMTDGFDIMSRIHSAGATIKVLDRAALDLSSPLGRAVLGLLSSVYQEERERIVARARAGIQEAKRRNVKFGRKPKLTASQAIEARRLVSEGKSYRQVAQLFSVHHQTIGRLGRAPG